MCSVRELLTNRSTVFSLMFAAFHSQSPLITMVCRSQDSSVTYNSVS